MAIRNRHPQSDDPELSAVSKDPYLRLAAAVVAQAVRDYVDRAKTPAKLAHAWDAAFFLASDARLYFDVLGMDDFDPMAALSITPEKLLATGLRKKL